MMLLTKSVIIPLQYFNLVCFQDEFAKQTPCLLFHYLKHFVIKIMIICRNVFDGLLIFVCRLILWNYYFVVVLKTKMTPLPKNIIIIIVIIIIIIIIIHDVPRQTSIPDSIVSIFLNIFINNTVVYFQIL